MSGKGFITAALSLCVLFCVLTGLALAENRYVLQGKDYALSEDSDFDYTQAEESSAFFYGAKSLGVFRVKGELYRSGQGYNGRPAFGARESLRLEYGYDGQFRKSGDGKWFIESDGLRTVRGYDLGFLNNIATGCVMIEKSRDGAAWEKAADPVRNYFDKPKAGKDCVLLEIPEDEYKHGMYYRVVVAYKMARKTGSQFLSSTYERGKCAEVYEFYVEGQRNYVSIRDLGNGGELADQGITDTGFMIRKNGSQASVSVEGRDGECQDFECFTEPGEYRIRVRSRLGAKYSAAVTVRNGIDFTALEPEVYFSEKGKGFPLETKTNLPIFGSYLSSLSLAVSKGQTVKKDGSVYGMTGDKIALYLKLNSSEDSLGEGWSLSADCKEKKAAGIKTGEIGKGALIIQTSSNGRDWSNVNKDRYAEGLYTTDYASHYGKGENVLIYTPYGQDVIKGMYIRVLLAYRVVYSDQKEVRDYVENYQFYLCSDELGAVVFHNLSLQEDALKEQFADADQNTVEVYRQAETLTDGSYTATGFTVDNKLNPTVKYTVTQNGGSPIEDRSEFTETGKYTVSLTSAVGSTGNLTIYVDRMTAEEALRRYFGDGFITGKRIYSEGEYPVYEGGETSYHVNQLGDDILPLCGKITNRSTGSEITVDQNPEEKTGILTEPGDYEAVFATSPRAFSGDLTGDARIFTFRFQVIPQGEAPGPAVNQKLLEEYSHTTAADSSPIYYGLTYTSAEKGKITLAFASREDAAAYAYEYEKGMVERQENGSFRYTGSFMVNQNVKYDSAWDLTDAVNYFANAAVHKHYFDLSEVFTYLSLDEETLKANPNLRQLELPRSVIIFAEGQKQKLTDLDALPLLNDKPYAFLDPETGEAERGVYSFRFITDQYGGIDSKRVTITDSEGKEHEIRYSESVYQQLLADQCPSGIVTVREETMYGDTAEYRAVYIAPNENQTELRITYEAGGEKKEAVFAGNAGEAGEAALAADSFTVSGLSDPVDPYAFVIVRHLQNEYFYTAKDLTNEAWTAPGPYTVTCRNRMGYGYTVSVTVGAETDGFADNPDAGVFTEDFASGQGPGSGGMDAGEDSEGTRTGEKTGENSEGTRTGEETGGTRALPILIGAAAILLAALAVLAYRKKIRFPWASKNQTGGEEDGHE